MARTALACLGLILLIAGAVQAQAQDPVAAARQLYASAEYEKALELLDRLAADAAINEHRQSVDLYRALCLLAIGRADDADRLIAAMIVRDPLYRPGEELSPRTLAAFGDAKKRMLPGIVQQRYADAKSAFERREFEAAAAAFRVVLDALADPDIAAAANQPPLSDVRTLAAGFHDLSLRSIPPPPPPPQPEPAPAPPPAPMNTAPAIYSGEEPGVRWPVTVAQEIPRYPGTVPPRGFAGIVEVVIDEKGRVESAAMIVGTVSSYDKLLLNAASRWQFEPAVLNGAPVKFRKRIQVNISPATH